MSVSLIDGHIDDDVQGKIDEVQALLKVTNLDLLREVVAEVRYKVRNGMPMLSNDRRKYILAIKAIDKQIPQKPSVSYHEGELVNYHCARCGEAQGLKVNKRWQRYCPHCGQALDWSDNDG